MKNGEIACVVGRVISGRSCCGSIVGYQRGTPSSNGAEKSKARSLKIEGVAPGCSPESILWASGCPSSDRVLVITRLGDSGAKLHDFVKKFLGDVGLRCALIGQFRSGQRISQPSFAHINDGEIGGSSGL